MRLSQSLYMIAGGRVGAGISCDGDSNVYLVKGPEGYVMFDVGCGRELERIHQQLEWDGIQPDEIECIVITHAHPDHVVGLPYWKKTTGARVLVPKDHVEYVQKGGTYYDNFLLDRPPLEPCSLDRGIAVGDVFEAGGLSFRALDGAGHTEGALYFRVDIDGKKLLITGDAFYYGGKLTIFNLPDSDLNKFKKTLLELQNEDFDAVLPGHRFPFLRNAKESLKRALLEVDSLLAGNPASRG